MKFLRTYAACLLIALAGISGLRAQHSGWNFPTQFGPSNAGTDFFYSVPSNWELVGDEKYIRFYITSPVQTNVTISIGGNIIHNLQTDPYGIVTADFSPAQAQVIVRTDLDPVPNDALYLNKAIRVQAEEPVMIYAMNRTTYTSDGMLLLPVNGLGKEYIVASYAAVIGVTQELPSQFVVVAPYDSTSVTITQPMRSPNHAAGETYTVMLNQGDVYSVMSIGYPGDMSGAVIEADKPVAVVAGQNCTYIPNVLTYCCCDYLAETMLPAVAWGKMYHAVPLASRLKGDIYRIFAREKNTKVYINGQEYANIDGPGGIVDEGWVEYRALTKDPVEISSNKPIAAFQYSTSASYDGTASDPFYIALTPQEQQGTQVVFSTPGTDFEKNYLNIVTDSANYHDVEISFGNSGTWQLLSQMPGASAAVAFTTRIHGKTYVGTSVAIAGGVWRLRAPEPFAGYSYGFDVADSYGYPIAMFTGDHSMNGQAPPAISQLQTCSGVVSGSISALASDGSRRAPLSIVAIVPGVGGNFDLELPAFKAGITSDAGYRLVPVDGSREAMAIVAAADMAGNVRFDTVRYVPGQVVDVRLTSADLIFTEGSLGTTSRRSVTVRNEGTQPVTITAIEMLDGTRGFNVVEMNLPLTLAAAGESGSSVQLDVEFAPKAAGFHADNLVVRGECGPMYALMVGGEAQGTLSAPLPVAGQVLGAVNVAPNPAPGAEALLTFTMAGRGNVTATIIDAVGREVRSMASGVTMEPGEQSLKLDLAGLPAGSYFVRIAAGGELISTPLVVVR